jgi:uncharacterized lipoprotein YmbA
MNRLFVGRISTHKVAILTPLVLLVTCSLALGRSNSNNNSPARVLGVAQVQIADGVTIPPDYVQELQKKLVQDLSQSRMFSAVQQDGESSTNSDLRLTWTITRFVSGNRLKRVASSYGRFFGVGATRLEVHAQLRDPVTNTVILDHEIKGSEKGALTSGSKNVVNTEADKISDDVVESMRKYAHGK